MIFYPKKTNLNPKNAALTTEGPALHAIYERPFSSFEFSIVILGLVEDIVKSPKQNNTIYKNKSEGT